MNRNLVLVLLAIVLVPLTALAALGWRLARDDEDRSAQQAKELMRSTLRSLDGEIHRLLEERSRDLQTLLKDVRISDLSLEREGLRDLRTRSRSLPSLRQAFVIASTGQWLYPSPLDPLSTEEDEFLRRMRDVELRPGEGPGSANAEAGQSLGPARGWQAYFWSDGLHLIYWWRGKSGLVVGAEFDRVRLLSDIIAALPDTDALAPRLADARIRLAGADGEVLYQWGGFQPEEREDAESGRHPRVRLNLSRPLAAWSLEYTSRGKGTVRALLGLLPGLLALGAVVGALAVYFYRESSREMRDAARRVSFVNQVSHELKTPLTNIRMYAELLENELADEDGAARRYTAVITAESQRLSRLILNILTFHQQQRQQLDLRPASGVLDDVLAGVLDSFRPAFTEHGIEIHFDAAASRPMAFDRDAIEQIIGNLLSNVEKYAASGRRVDLVSRQQDDTARVTVTDHGPGIAAQHRQRIFQPFHRISNALTDGVSGTGLGLALARDLARLHGGDLECLSSPAGTTSPVGTSFQLTLPLSDPPGQRPRTERGPNPEGAKRSVHRPQVAGRGVRAAEEQP